jgi:peptide/nickel transport system substrate-binding protein
MSKTTVQPIGEMAAENWHRFGNAETDVLLTKLETTTDPAEEQRLFVELQKIFVANAPTIPLFPGPLWGEYNTQHFAGFPDRDNPYAPLAPHLTPQALLVVTEIRPK